jgi:uncharacterized protein YkwD
MLALCGFSSAACGGGTSSTRFGGPGLPGETIEAPAASAERYVTAATSEGAVVGGGNASAVEAGIRRAASEAQLTLTGDARLGLLAAWTAERLGEGGEPPPHDVVEFFTRNLGLIEPVPHILVIGQPDPAALEASIHDSVAQFLARQPYDHYGAAVVLREGLTLALVTLSTRSVELTPVARQQPAGRPVRLRGRLLGRLERPTFAVTQPSGEVERIAGGAGPAFDVNIPIGAAGVYRVELLAQGSRGDTVVANFPLFAGVDVPTSITLAAPSAAASGDVGDIEAQLFALLNESRRTQGRPPLVRDDAIARVALAHSRDMVAHNFVGHTSPTTGTAAERVQRAGLRSGLVLENIGRGYSAQEIHSGLLESPGHRANIFNPDVTHVGFGVIAEPEGARTAFVATEVFLRMAHEIDLAAAPAELLAMLNSAREARGSRPLESDPNLSRAATDAAAQFFSDPRLSQQDVVDDASASLRRFSIQFRRIGGLMAVVTDLSEAGTLEPALDGQVRYVGLGVAQGTRPDTGPNAISVVIMLGWGR